MDKGSGITPLGGFDNPTLYNMANIKSDVMNDCIKQDHLVLGYCGHMEARFEFGTKKVIPDLRDRLGILHLKCRHL